MRRQEPEGYAPVLANADPRPPVLSACGCGSLIPPWRRYCSECQRLGSASRIRRWGFDPLAEDDA